MAARLSDFQANVLSSVNQGIRSLYDASELCDLKVTVGQKTFNCHRVVLASVSGYFQSLISRDGLNKHTTVVQLKHDDVTPESFQMLLDILYKTEDVVTKDTAKDIVRMSIYLQVKFLEQHCEEYIRTNITPEECVSTWLFAEKYQLHKLAQTAAAMASDSIDQVVQYDEIIQLPKAMLLIVLATQSKLSMDDICKTILRWVEKDAENRQVHFGELLPFVSFPQLSPAYISELMKYGFDHPFSKFLAESIREALSFNLSNQTQEQQRLVIARQDRVRTNDQIQKCVVIIGGSDADEKRETTVLAVRADPGTRFSSFPLKVMPESCGSPFVSCVWKNELYVSWGNSDGIFLAKYITGSDVWETLPEFKPGLQRYSIAAVSGRIYVTGGSMAESQEIFQGVLSYDINGKKWMKLENKIPVAADSATVAVLGHRVYIFGGRDERRKPTDTVQCLDTIYGSAYIAGRLPSAPEELVALSDGGTIYVICDGAQVVKMAERFEAADTKERELFKGIEGKTAPTVDFIDVGEFTGHKCLSAYLHNGEIVECGGLSSEGAVLQDVRSMNLATGQISKKRPAFKGHRRYFQFHTMNIPQEFLDDEKASYYFQQGDQVRLKNSTPAVTRQYCANTGRYYSLSHGDIGTIQSVTNDGQVTASFYVYDCNYRGKFTCSHNAHGATLRYA